MAYVELPRGRGRGINTSKNKIILCGNKNVVVNTFYIKIGHQYLSAMEERDSRASVLNTRKTFPPENGNVNIILVRSLYIYENSFSFVVQKYKEINDILIKNFVKVATTV